MNSSAQEITEEEALARHPVVPVEYFKLAEVRVSDVEIQRELEKVASSRVAPLCALLAVILVVPLWLEQLTGEKFWDWESLRSRIVWPAGLLVLCLATRRGRAPDRWTHPALTLALLLALASTLGNIYVTGLERHSVPAVLLLLAAGALLPSTGWFVVVALAIHAGFLWVANLALPTEAIRVGELHLLLANGMAAYLHIQQKRTARRKARTDLELDGHRAALARAIEAAEGAGQRYRLLSDATVDGIILHHGGRIVDLNRSAARLFCCDPKDALGTPIADLVTPESRGTLESLQWGDQTKFEIFAQTRAGSIVQVQFWNRSVSVPTGRLTVTSIRNMSEESRQRELAELQNAQLQFHFSQQRALAEATATARTVENWAERAEQILQNLDQSFPVSIGSVLVARSYDSFQVIASTVPEAGLGSDLSAGNSLIRVLEQTAQPLLVSDLARDPFGVGRLFPKVPARSCAAVPCADQGTVYFILLVFDAVPRLYRQEDLEFLGGILAACRPSGPFRLPRPARVPARPVESR